MQYSEKIEIIKDFVEYCVNFLKLENVPKIEFTQDRNWVLGIHSFGQYQNEPKSLKVYIGNRNLADVLRTLSHELVHHRQNELNMLDPHAGDTGSDIENQANTISGIIMRNYGKQNELIYESNLTSIMDNVRSTSMTIFCDMDGVLCDFEAQFDHYYGTTPREYSNQKGAEIFKKAVDEIGIKFWSEMPYFPGAQAIWSYISDYSPIILSSPSTFKFAKPGKLMWIKNHLNPQPKDIIFEQTRQKQNALANRNPKKCILIDDYYGNIIPWKDAGAIGIKHDSAEKTITILKKFRL